jgi:hypothetical protein
MKTHQQVTCPHCGKVGGSNTMKTWHFDRCKDGPNLRPPRRPRALKDVKIENTEEYVVTYHIILKDRSVHPTAYSLLFNAELALATRGIV